MNHNRRRILRSLAAGAFGVTLEQRGFPSAGGDYRLYWGDLHNHNSVGYAQGSIERTYEIAREHLDFIAFTPHAQWHDLPTMPNNAHQKWIDGFQVLRDSWGKVQRLASEHNQKGKFVSYLAYEWHSSFFGDHCIYYTDDNRPLEYFDHVRNLQAYCRAANAFAIPHHIAYRQGCRGANFDFFDPATSPAVEIFSEHGLSESDSGPRDYLTHSMGGRWTHNTLKTFLQRGLRAGLVASSDDHLGFPGAYGEGLTGIYARELSRSALTEAIRARRTVAVSGDRIGVILKINRHWMGSTLPFVADREIEFSARGQDEIERVEIVKNSRVIHRYFPADHTTPGHRWAGEALARVEFGWGPWGPLALTRTCDWDFMASVHAGKLLSAAPCLQSGPFDERRRHRIVRESENSCRMISYTSRRDAYRETPTNALILHVAGGPETVIEVSLVSPAKMTVRKKLGELVDYNDVWFTGGFTSESILLHRLITPELFNVSFRFSDKGRRGQTDWYYARVCQANTHQAWSSPIWVEG